MAAETAADGAAHAPTASEYIVHHLGHLSTKHQDKIVDFSIINLDTVFWSVLMGVVGLSLMIYAARRATAGVPGRFQAFVEMIVEMVNDQAKNIVHGDRSFIAPLALTVFVWVFLMNSLDFLPVDLFAGIFRLFGADPHFRIVPTADLNGTLGMAVGVLALMLYYNVKIKGLGGWIHELFTAPFGSHPLLWPFNFLMQMIEFVAKTVSHGMRLFGNMFAGELVFMLIALMGGGWALSATGVGLAIGHVIAGTVWTLFHILVITLQAFIFMMLTLIYTGQAHDAH